MDGGAGIDTVDYGLNTSSTTVNLTQPSGCEFAFQDFFPSHGHGDGINCSTDVPPFPADRRSHQQERCGG